MVPAPSTPGIRGKRVRPGLRQEPSRIDASQLPTPAVAIAMTTSCGPGLGTGTSCRVRTDAGPKRSTAAAFIVAVSRRPGVDHDRWRLTLAWRDRCDAQ